MSKKLLSGLDCYNLINDEETLFKIKTIAFLNHDCRPVWIGPGLAKYEKEIVELSYYDNKHLIDGSVPIRQDNGSHYRIILKHKGMK